MEFREHRRTRLPNLAGEVIVRVLETLPPANRARLRRWLWSRRTYLVVTSGRDLIRGALAGFPSDVRALCASAPVMRYDDRSGGGYWPDRNEIWLAAGVETYERRAQVFLSARHELFHYVCWNHPAYRLDEQRGFTAMLQALRAARPDLPHHPRYAAWVRSFLTQGDHANPVEYFADVPTNFRNAADLPPSLAHHFAPLIDGSPLSSNLSADHPRSDMTLAAFHELISPDHSP